MNPCPTTFSGQDWARAGDREWCWEPETCSGMLAWQWQPPAPLAQCRVKQYGAEQCGMGAAAAAATLVRVLCSAGPGPGVVSMETGPQPCMPLATWPCLVSIETGLWLHLWPQMQCPYWGFYCCHCPCTVLPCAALPHNKLVGLGLPPPWGQPGRAAGRPVAGVPKNYLVGPMDLLLARKNHSVGQIWLTACILPPLLQREEVDEAEGKGATSLPPPSPAFLSVAVRGGGGFKNMAQYLDSILGKV